MSRDPFTRYDAAYVLGALSPGDRQAFERHLGECDRCRRAVAEVAGLPGLLARVDPAELEPPEGHPAEASGERGTGPLPDTLLPRLLREVDRSGRRRRTRALLVGVAAAAAVAAVSAGVTARWGGVPAPQPAPPVAVGAPGRPMTQVDQTQLSARVALEPVAWGTRLRITCTYDPRRYVDGPPPEYALFVRTRQGAEERVATWRAVEGTPTTVVAATASRPWDIRSLEVRTTDGEPVLRLAG